MKKTLLLLTSAAYILNSCQTIRYAPVEKAVETKTEVVEIVRDTTIYLPADRAMVKALLECDSAGQILIRQVETLQGKLNAKADIRMVEHTIIADCVCDSMNIYLQLKDRYQTNTTNTTETKVLWKEKELKWWQKMLLWMGGISLIVITMGLVLTLKKRIF